MSSSRSFFRFAVLSLSSIGAFLLSSIAAFGQEELQDHPQDQFQEQFQNQIDAPTQEQLNEQVEPQLQHLATPPISEPEPSKRTSSKRFIGVNPFPKNCNVQQPERAFRPEVSEFDAGNAYWTQFTARLSGAEKRKARQVLFKAGFPNLHIVDNSKSQMRVLIFSNAHSIVVSFRGSQYPRNWFGPFGDFNFQQEDAALLGMTGKLHRGFYSGLQAVYPQVKAAVKAMQNDDNTKPVFLSGHSLGGALAVLTAALFEKQGMPVRSIYTSGQPRIGDATFVSQLVPVLGEKLFRLVQENDIVARLPPPAVAAPDFADAISRLGVQKQFASDTFVKLNYVHFGNVILMPSTPQQSPLKEVFFDDSEDASYWSTFAARFNTWPPRGVFRSAMAMIGEHFNGVYLCRLVP